ncbi:MAG: RNA-binding protein [Candidatus Hydrogenedentota bacterium]|nr:MAG: RNA-binding protein [Candidatus Hydrogenedentota bacterium]
MNIYVGNLAYSATEAELSNVFSAFGTVSSARIITDKYTGKSRGFGFVEMENDAEAKNAIANLNGSEMNNRTLVVNEARPRREKNYRQNNYSRY